MSFVDKEEEVDCDFLYYHVDNKHVQNMNYQIVWSNVAHSGVQNWSLGIKRMNLVPYTKCLDLCNPHSILMASIQYLAY